MTELAAVPQVLRALMESGAWRAVYYTDPKQTVRATRRWYKHAGSRNARVEVSLTIGKPNYRERAFIAACKKAGEPFPVKKVQLQFKAKGK